MTEKQAQQAIIRKFQNQYRLMVPNVYYFSWESDLLCIGVTGLITEIEIKASKWDYITDFKKVEKHEKLSNATDLTEIPNKFIYAVDEKFVNDIQVPDYAGLIVIHQKGMNRYAVLVKKPTRLHTLTMNPERWEKLAISLAYKIDR